MTDVNIILSIITLNINCLINPVKRHTSPSERSNFRQSLEKSLKANGTMKKADITVIILENWTSSQNYSKKIKKVTSY